MATQESGGEFFLSIDDQEVTTTQVVNSTGGWSQFSTFEVSDIILPAGEHRLKFHINNDIPFNISSIEFENTGTVDALALNALNGKTGESENALEITISESILPTSLNATSDQFTVLINGIQKTVTSVISDPLRARLMVLNLDDFFLLGDDITVSYSGTTIQSQSNKTLNTFSDLVINNIAKDRAIIPTVIQVEEYEFMEGMGLEDTSRC